MRDPKELQQQPLLFLHEEMPDDKSLLPFSKKKHNNIGEQEVNAYILKV